MIVDAETGEAYLRPRPDMVRAVNARIAVRAQRRAEFARLRATPAFTRDGVKITLKAAPASVVLGKEQILKASVALTLTYPASTGRNFTELLRTIDSLQLTDNFKVATPVNWKQGEDVIITTAVNDEEAQSRFPEGWKTLKPYLRFVKQPERETQKV